MFDPVKELQAIKVHRSLARKKRYQQSKLSRYRAELVELRRAGASFADLALWLQLQHKVRAQPSSIQRFLASLDESSGEPDDGQIS